MRDSTNRALRRQRVALLSAVVAGPALALLAEAATRRGPVIAALPIVPLLAFLAYVLVTLFRRPSRADLRLDEAERAFVAPPRSRWGIGTTPFVAFAGYQAVGAGLDADGATLIWIFAVVWGAVALALAVDAWRRVPSVDLTPDGVLVGRPRRRLSVPWSAIDEDRVATPSRATELWRMPIRPAVRGRHRRATVPLWEVDVAPRVLAGAVRHYASHPEHRAAIGTHDEHLRLRQVLADGG